MTEAKIDVSKLATIPIIEINEFVGSKGSDEIEGTQITTHRVRLSDKYGRKNNPFPLFFRDDKRENEVVFRMSVEQLKAARDVFSEVIELIED